MRSAIVVVLAALSGWLVRGMNDVESAPAPPPAPAESAVMRETGPDVMVPRVAQLQLPVDSRGNRDLFAYREMPVAEARPQPVVEQHLPAAMPISPPAPLPPAVITPPRPPFPYRFIGAFGSREVRVAAFSRDGEVVTARVGDRVGNFVVEAIGRESVDVRASDGAVERVGIASSI